MTSDRLLKQLEFIAEIDKLKNVFRQSYITDGSRRENSAEHSWHFAVMALVLAEHSDEPVDVLRVVKMALIHDIVEIDAGDTFIYDTSKAAEKEKKEHEAALRLFGMLPEDQAAEYRALWDEFEARQTPDARFAAALDRLGPVMLNYHTQGRAWQNGHVRSEDVLRVNSRIGLSSEELWAYARGIIEDSVAKGYLQK